MTRSAWSVIESRVVGKSSDPDLCEDVIVTTESYVAIIDGATDKSGRTDDGVTPGRAAAAACARALEGLSATASGDEAVRAMSQEVAGLRAVGEVDAPSAAVCVVSLARREVWQVGDVAFAIAGNPSAAPPLKRIDAVVAAARAAYTSALLAQGMSVEEVARRDPGREFVLPLLRAQHVFRNQPGAYGFGAIDGHEVPGELIRIEPLPAGEVEVILHSDGYPRTWPTLVEAEEGLAELLARDPLCIAELEGTKGILPGNTSYDDRAYLRVRATG